MSQTIAAHLEWTAVLDQISDSLAESLKAVTDRAPSGAGDDSESFSFSASALDEIDCQLRGFDERLVEIRTLAHTIEATLAADESAVQAFRKSAAEARERSAPAGRLS